MSRARVSQAALTPEAREPLTITHVALKDLVPAERNARTHSNEQIEQIAGSIKQFGFTNPILVDESLQIIAGHGRLAAARHLKWKEKVPVITLRGLTAAQKRALALADNRIALNSGWDDEILAVELNDLNDNGEVDLETLGFDQDELLKYLRITGKEPPPPDGESYESTYSVIINLNSESEQVKLLERLTAEGYECRALIA